MERTIRLCDVCGKNEALEVKVLITQDSFAVYKYRSCAPQGYDVCSSNCIEKLVHKFLNPTAEEVLAHITNKVALEIMTKELNLIL